MSKPMVLTLEELLKLPHRAVVYKETKDGNTVERYVIPMIVTRGHTLIDEDGEINIDEKMLEPIPLFMNGPRVRRFWNKKPDMKRRREVSWK